VLLKFKQFSFGNLVAVLNPKPPSKIMTLSDSSSQNSNLMEIADALR
jgi:hypothetical protein